MVAQGGSTFMLNLVFITLTIFSVFFVAITPFPARWQYAPYMRPSIYSMRRTPAPLEIRLEKGSLYREGIGGTFCGLRAILMFANATGAVITQKRLSSGAHTYFVGEFLRFRRPLTERRRSCTIHKGRLERKFWQALAQCERWNANIAREVFNDCNTLHVNFRLGHPRHCIAHTAPLVRAFWKTPLPAPIEQKDVCVLRRGGDIERRIERPNATDFQWMIDENRTIPILDEARKRGSKIVLITQTRFESRISTRYHVPDVVSNNERLNKVLDHISRCRCLFLAGYVSREHRAFSRTNWSSGTSFAVAAAQLAQPRFIIYTESRSDWKFRYPSWNVHEFGERAIPITAPKDEIMDKCTSPSA